MKNAWKWILGIILVLAIMSIPFVLHYAFGNNLVRGFDSRVPMMQPFGRDPHGFGPGFRAPMTGRRGGFGFFGPFMFFGGVLRLVLFGALLYGAYWLGKRNARVVLAPAPAAAPLQRQDRISRWLAASKAIRVWRVE